MTLQQYGELHDDAHRLDPEIVKAMAARAADADHNTTPWVVEYEIPPETNGWIYLGNPGAVSTTHYWVDRYPGYSEAVVLHHTPTHPRDETSDVIQVTHETDLSTSLRNGDVIVEIEGESYRTPLYVQRRMFWEAAEAAIKWMEEHAPSDDVQV